jgi:hypothetical protein
VKNDIQQRAVDLQPIFAIVDEAQFSKPVHEEADSRSGCADHIGERFLTNLGDHRFGTPSLPKCASKSRTLASLFSLELKS